MKQLEPFFKILTDTNGDSATMLLYGYIGERWEYDPETDRYKMTGVTDVDFFKELSALAEKYPVIHIRLNGPGGDVLHGNAILTAIQNCKAEVHTWNDGVCASMCADIWMMGHVRHMAKNAMLMIHAPWSVTVGNAKKHLESAAILDLMADAVITATASATGKTEDDVRAAYYADYADHWLNYNMCQADGLLSGAIDDYAAADLPPQVEKMTHLQLMKHFEQKDNPDSPGVLARAKAAFQAGLQKVVGRKSILITTQPSPEMTLEEFEKALTDGTLNVADIQARLDSLQKTTTEATDKTAAEDTTKIDQRYQKMEDQLADLQEIVKTWGPKPGAQKSMPITPDKDHKTDTDVIPDPLAEYNKTMAEAAAGGETVRFTQ